MLTLMQLISHFTKLNDVHTLYFAMSDLAEGLEEMSDFVSGLNAGYGIELNAPQIEGLNRVINKGTWESCFKVNSIINE